MAGTNNTPFSPNADKTAQMTGSGVAVPGAISPTYASTQALGSILQYSTYVRLLGVNSVSATSTVTTTFVALAGARLAVSCEATGGTVTYTFSTGFKVSGTAAPTTGTALTVNFVSNGTNWVEVGRSSAITI